MPTSTDNQQHIWRAYLACIVDKLNGLNVSLQGNHTDILTLNDIYGFTRKVERIARTEMGKIDTLNSVNSWRKMNLALTL